MMTIALRPISATFVSFVLAASLAAMPESAALFERGTVSGVQRERPRINLGVLRADGILLPFASFDGDDWSASWPSDLAQLDLPVNVESVPQRWWGGVAPANWRVFAQGGGPPRPLKPDSPVTISVGVARRLGLHTDHAPAPVRVPPYEVPFPKVGLAVAGDVDLEPLPSISRTDKAVPEFLESIRGELTSVEERTVNGLRGNVGWKHPFDKNARSRVEPELEAWYATSLAEAGTRVSYIEAVKKYPPQPKDDGCGLETFITGWVHQTAKQQRPRTMLRALVVYCDREQASYMLPLGQLTIANRTYWIFQMAGRDQEWYVVAEATRSRVRVVAEYLAGIFPPSARLGIR